MNFANYEKSSGSPVLGLFIQTTFSVVGTLVVPATD